MNDVRFSEPVFLKFRTASRKVASSFEALECLDQQWPEWARGRNWRAASRACRDALDGWRSARDAQKALLKAARSAGVIAAEAHSRGTSRSVRINEGLRPDALFSERQ